MLLLELTCAHDWRQDWASTTDAFRVQRYPRLQTLMQALLRPRWVVETVPLTVGLEARSTSPPGAEHYIYLASARARTMAPVTSRLTQIYSPSSPTRGNQAVLPTPQGRRPLT